jgi:hypothetical protein
LFLQHFYHEAGACFPNLGLGKVTELIAASIAFQFRLLQHSRKFREPRPCGLAGKIAQRQEYASDSRVTVS